MADARQDRASAVVEADLRPESLVGSYFHSTAALGWQGVVVAEPSPGVFLCELFSWMAGDSTEQVLVWLADMRGWHFYDDADWMHNAYEHGVRQQWEQERPETKPAFVEQST